MGFSNLFDYTYPYNVPLGLCYLIIDTILYQILAIYLEKVVPSKFSRAEHPLFFLFPSYWRGLTKQEASSSEHPTTPPRIELLDATVEDEQEEVGIELAHLSKVFTSGIIVSDDILTKSFYSTIESYFEHRS